MSNFDELYESEREEFNDWYQETSYGDSIKILGEAMAERFKEAMFVSWCASVNRRPQ